MARREAAVQAGSDDLVRRVAAVNEAAQKQQRRASGASDTFTAVSGASIFVKKRKMGEEKKKPKRPKRKAMTGTLIGCLFSLLRGAKV